MPLDDAPDHLLEQARLKLRAEHAQNAEAEQGRRLARRIGVAFVLVALAAVVLLVVLPSLGLALPPMLMVLAFLTIALGAVMAFVGDLHAARMERDPGDDSPRRPPPR